VNRLNRLTTRRDFLRQTGCGFGSLALAGLLAESLPAGGPTRPTIDPVNPFAVRAPHIPATARRVIFLYQYGGPSHLDLFDRKPELARLHGQQVPDSFRRPNEALDPFVGCENQLLAPPWRWSQHGQSGQWISELLSHTARFADDLEKIGNKTEWRESHRVGGKEEQSNAGIRTGEKERTSVQAVDRDEHQRV
jgi:hypothetical protein